MLDLLAIGDVMIDHFFVLDDAQIDSSLAPNEQYLCVRYGDKIAVQKYVHSVAGNAANVAVGAARLKLAVGLVTLVGQDSGGREIIHKMKKEGVRTEHIHVNAQERTNISSVMSFRGERTILVYHAPREWNHTALPKAKWYYLTSLGPITADFRHLHRRIAETLERMPLIRLAFNPGTFQLKAGMKFLKPLLRRTELLFVNKEEAETITDQGPTTSMPTLLSSLHRSGVTTPIITDGAKGAWALDEKDSILHCPATNDPVVERTGAGDSFATATLASIINGNPLSEALRWGAVESANVVSMIGPQAGLLTLQKLKKNLKRQRSLKTTVSPSL
ncbi:carbohydrate kinase family protein [Candidatus Uhrbacteria bacterium]|nr:carbohydrate kinase family protein [Candidatus Uhrbacteria bacterium]